LAALACTACDTAVHDRTTAASAKAVVVGLAILEKQLNAGLPTGKPNDRTLSFAQRFRASLVDWLEQVVQNTLLPRQNVDACDHSGKDRESLILLA
jgi:hypothetical protein